MKIITLALGGAAIIAAGVFGLRSTESSGASAATFEGCLRTGSASTVFLLRGGKEAGSDADGRDYLLVAIDGSVDPGPAVNHQVTIDGDASTAADGPAPPAGANTVERALRRLSVRALRDSGRGC